MSAREAIHARIHGEGYCAPPCGLCVEVQDLLDAHAHELAEKTREYTRRQYGRVIAVWGADRARDWFVGGESAADFIDPEVSG